MNILLCPDSFKESLSGKELSGFLRQGILNVDPTHHVEISPVSDGGEGLLEILMEESRGKTFSTTVTGPLGKPVGASYGIMNLRGSKVTIIETAQVVGLHLVPESRRNPMITTTYGVGELIMDSLNHQPDEIIIGLGGSATNDGGAGMLQALGFHIRDAEDNEIGYGNICLSKIHSIEIPMNHPVLSLPIQVASDVTNPLLGPHGASFVFGKQKGASDGVLLEMDQNMEHFANIARQTLGRDISKQPGSGAAGGLGGSLTGFLKAKLQPGFEIVAARTGIEEKIKSADLIITGEGKVDTQTVHGKAPFGVAVLGKKYGKKTMCVFGVIDPTAESVLKKWFDPLVPLSRKPISREDSIQDARRLAIETGMYIASNYCL